MGFVFPKLQLSDYPPGMFDHLSPRLLRAMGFVDAPAEPPATPYEVAARRHARAVMDAFGGKLIVEHDPMPGDALVDPRDGTTHVTPAVYERLVAEVAQAEREWERTERLLAVYRSGRRRLTAAELEEVAALPRWRRDLSLGALAEALR
jgi:hypothetical protein